MSRLIAFVKQRRAEGEIAQRWICEQTGLSLRPCQSSRMRRVGSTSGPSHWFSGASGSACTSLACRSTRRPRAPLRDPPWGICRARLRLRTLRPDRTEVPDAVKKTKRCGLGAGPPKRGFGRSAKSTRRDSLFSARQGGAGGARGRRAGPRTAANRECDTCWRAERN